MSEITLRQLTITVLTKTKIPMTAKEVWNYAFSSNEIDTSKFNGVTPWSTINAIISTDIKNKGDACAFIRISGIPVRFGLKNINYDDEYKDEHIVDGLEETSTKKDTMKEKELHKYLAYFAFYRFNAYTKTIDEKKSKKGTKGANEWLHPDMVGIYSPREDWEEDVLELNGLMRGMSAKTYSFEIKLELGFSNLRESFFQTVSNSYWSNESYLAAKEIDDSRDFSDELKRLSSLFGIGIIKIDVAEPQNSIILHSATNRPQLDWDTINKLCEVNTDFAEYVNAIIVILSDKSKRLKRTSISQHFDKIYSLENFEKNHF
jgi:hypothetical protein